MNTKIYKYNLEARGYELDSFGHVNNAVYLNYFEQARWNIVKELGIIDYFKSTESLLVVVDVHIRYVKEIQLFNLLTVETTISVSEPYLIFKHALLSREDGEKHAKATVKTLFLDSSRKPVDIPEDLVMNLASLK